MEALINVMDCLGFTVYLPTALCDSMLCLGEVTQKKKKKKKKSQTQGLKDGTHSQMEEYVLHRTIFWFSTSAYASDKSSIFPDPSRSTYL